MKKHGQKRPKPHLLQKQRAGKKESLFFTEVMIIDKENTSGVDYFLKEICNSNCWSIPSMPLWE